MRKTKILWCLLALLSLVAAATVVVRLNLWNFSGVQPSGLYLQYKDMPGIQASFIKDKYINDSVCVDVTLLKAVDSSNFMQLLTQLDTPKDLVKLTTTLPLKSDRRFASLHPKGHPELPMDPVKMNNDVVVVFPAVRSVAVFHISKEEQIKLILLGNTRKTLNI